MQASDRLLAQRYARALFEAARAAGEAEQVRQELSEAGRKLREHEGSFAHPLLPAEEKRLIVKQALGQITKTAENFFGLLISKKRWGLLPSVTAAYERALDEANGIVRAQVRAALPLADAEKDKLRQGLEKFTGKKVQLEVREAPELIGGFTVRMGDWVLDSSFSHALTRMREALG
jgi:F-type H+-transporting ATPase subunit delta